MVFPIPVIIAAIAAPPAQTVTHQTLSSGVHLIVSPRPGASLVSIEIRVRGAGSGSETAEENGLAHAVEHMVFKGTDTKAPGAFDAAFERLGGEASAQTLRDGTAFRVCVFPEKWKDALALWGELLQKPAFRESDWTSERTVILREMRVAQSDTAKLGLQTLASVAYPAADPYRQPLMGTRENIYRFSTSELRGFHARKYLPANLTIAISGPVTAEEVQTVVEGLGFQGPEAASSAVASPVPSPPITDSTIAAPTRAPLFTDDEQTARRLATVYVGFRAPRLQTDPNSAAACDVLAALLARGTGGVLGTRLFHDAKLKTVSVRADYLPQADRSLFVIQATSEKRDIGRVEDGIVAEIDNLVQRISTDEEAIGDELEAAKAAAIGEQQYMRETVDGESQYLGFLDMVNAPEGYAEKYAERVRAVTLSDISRLLERYIAPGKRVVSVIGLGALSGPSSAEPSANRREEAKQ